MPKLLKLLVIVAVTVAGAAWVRGASPRADAMPGVAAAGSGPLDSPAACARYLERHPRAAQRPPRVGTWNVRWFPRGTADGRDAERRTDVAWLACAIAALEVDVLALQEVMLDQEGRAARLDLIARLDALTGGSWEAQFDDCADGRQHVGLLHDRSRVEIEGPRTLAALNPGRDACDRNLRPGYGAYARFRDGPDLHLLTLHLDSGTTRRDHDNRARSLSRLGGVLRAMRDAQADEDVLVLGDFNTMGCRECELPTPAEVELAVLDDVVGAAGLRRVAMAPGLDCSQYYRRRAGKLDLVLASAGMRELAAETRVQPHGPCRRLRCARLPTPRPAAYRRLSDHCPLVVDLTAQDLD